MQAFVFFWLAGLFFLLGALVAFFSKDRFQRRLGAGLGGLGFVSLLATPWTISFSPSSAFGHLLGSVIGPTVLLAVGFYQIAFSGNVPVGRLSKQDRIIGVLMVMAGVLWFEAMHWWHLTPTYPDDVNRYWLIFWPTMLLFGFACATGAHSLVGLVGHGRHREQRLMILIALFTAVLMLMGVFLNGPAVSSEMFTVELLLAAADLFGVMVGAAVAIVLFSLVLVVYEKQQLPPKRLDPPTAEQLAAASHTIAQHLTGGEE